MTKNQVPGKILFSFDFELMWGVFDSSGNTYNRQIDSTANGVFQIIDLLTSKNVRTTWGCVGALRLYSIKDLDCKLLHARLNETHIPDEELYRALENHNNRFFAPEVIRELQNAKQELISHSFFHRVATPENVEILGQEIVKCWNVLNSSDAGHIFCRNQYSDEILSNLENIRLDFFRSNPDNWLYREGRFYRYLRYLDSFVPLWSGVIMKAVTAPSGRPLGIPHTLFLRPHNKFIFLNKLHWWRICFAIWVLKFRGGLLHFWVHPHNFSMKDGTYNIALLKKLFAKLEDCDFDLQTDVQTMGDFYQNSCDRA